MTTASEGLVAPAAIGRPISPIDMEAYRWAVSENPEPLECVSDTGGEAEAGKAGFDLSRTDGERWAVEGVFVAEGYHGDPGFGKLIAKIGVKPGTEFDFRFIGFVMPRGDRAAGCESKNFGSRGGEVEDV